MSETKKETISQKLSNIRAEAKKIIWPDRPELIKKTTTVIFTCLLFAVILFGIDSVYSTIYNFAVDSILLR